MTSTVKGPDDVRIAGEWRERPLASLTDNFDGIRVPVKGADRRPGPSPYYGASAVVDHVDNYRFDTFR